MNADDIREIIFNQEIPKCQKCAEVGILKPDIVFFGESLPENYHKAILEDKEKCDLLIVIGSSLKVKPVAHIPSMLKEDVPQILINRESLNHMNFDIELLGDCDIIVKELLLRLGEDWTTVGNQVTLNSSEKQELIDDDKIIEEIILECEKSVENPTVDIEKTFVSSFLKGKNESFCGLCLIVFRLENTFIHLKPNMYVFHGAEIRANVARKQILTGGNEDESDDEYTSDSSEETSSSCSSETASEKTADLDKDSLNAESNNKTKSSLIPEIESVNPTVKTEKNDLL